MQAHDLRARLRRRLAVLAALVVACLLVATPARSEVPSSDATGPAGTARTVDDAVLRWGLSNEANNAAWLGTNFFSAGRVADPGKGGTTLTQSGWSQRSGSVSIEKWLKGRWQPATWAGLFTDTDGKDLVSPTDGRFSGHQIVFADGVGTVDPAAGTAHLAWQGDATVLLYSGQSFFYLSDPVLDVADGKGTLTGTLSGFASSQTDTSVWEPVAPATVTFAELPEVQLGADDFTATPSYGGSFPESWVDFMERLGTGSYWYRSNSVTDAFKAPLPVTIGYGATAKAPPPAQGTTKNADPVRNTAPEPPKASPTNSPKPPDASPSSVSTTSAGSVAPTGAATDATVPVAGAPVQQLVQLRAAHADTSDPAGVPNRWWWGSGAVLLALSLVTIVSSLAGPRSR